MFKVMLTKEGSAKIVNLMTLIAGILVQGCGHTSHTNLYALSFTLAIYSTLIIIVLSY